MYLSSMSPIFFCVIWKRNALADFDEIWQEGPTYSVVVYAYENWTLGLIRCVSTGVTPLKRLSICNKLNENKIK